MITVIRVADRIETTETDNEVPLYPDGAVDYSEMISRAMDKPEPDKITTVFMEI